MRDEAPAIRRRPALFCEPPPIFGERHGNRRRARPVAVPMPPFRLERLSWSDLPLGEVEFPNGTMALRSGFGSGLARRPADPPGTVWAVCDRGPNIKVKSAVEDWGLAALEPHVGEASARLMPRPEIGPAIAELRVTETSVELIRTLPIATQDGRPVSGLPLPPGPDLLSEPAFGMNGARLAPDPRGFDSEGIAALTDGGFWIGDEFGPSLVRLDAGARLLVRLVPECVALDAPYPVERLLPAIAARRQLNRGFEALAPSADGKWLYLAFQSPLAHPDKAAHEAARHVRLWRLDAGSGAFSAQFLYPLDPPQSFRRDVEKGEFARADVKLSEIAATPSGALIVLERGAETTKLYRIEPGAGQALPPEQLDPATRPTVEELSGREGSFPLPVLAKTLLFSSDEAPELPPDMEGMALLSDRALLLVNDNDFGVEGAETSFWRLTFEAPLLA
jgi:hypothetical protein